MLSVALIVMLRVVILNVVMLSGNATCIKKDIARSKKSSSLLDDLMFPEFETCYVKAGPTTFLKWYSMSFLFGNCHF
jgi:hypothetical protein